MNISDNIWTCPQCGAWNAPYRVLCGKCEENKTMKKRQFRSRQGRSDSRYSESIKVIGAAAILLVSVSIIGLIVDFIIN